MGGVNTFENGDLHKYGLVSKQTRGQDSWLRLVIRQQDVRVLNWTGGRKNEKGRGETDGSVARHYNVFQKV